MVLVDFGWHPRAQKYRHRRGDGRSTLWSSLPSSAFPAGPLTSTRGKVKGGLGATRGHCRSTVSGSWKLHFSLPSSFTCFATLKPCQSVEVPAFAGPALGVNNRLQREVWHLTCHPGLLALGVWGPPDLSRELPALCSVPWSSPRLHLSWGLLLHSNTFFHFAFYCIWFLILPLSVWLFSNFFLLLKTPLVPHRCPVSRL